MEREMSLKTRWLLVVAGGVIMGAALGIRNVQGLYMLPVTLDRGWSREAFSLAIALQNLVWGLAQPFTGMVADRFGTAKVIFAGTLMYALGLFLMAHSATPTEFTFASGMLIGIALSGTAFGAIYGGLSRLVPAKHRSWALGVAGAIGGLGQFLMVPIAQRLLGGMNWGSSLLILCALMIVVAPLSAWLRDDPAHQVKTGEHNQTATQAIREALGHRGFWLLNIGFVACGFQLAFIAGHLPAYIMDKGMDLNVAGKALAIIALANVIGTYLFGHLGGILRRKYLLSLLYFVRAVAMAAFVLFPISEFSVYLFSFVIGLFWLGTVPLTTGLVSQVFGVRYITTLFGVVFFGHQVGSFFGVWLAGYVFDVTKSYDLIWFGSVALGLFAAAVHLPIDDKQVIRAPQPAGQAA